MSGKKIGGGSIDLSGVQGALGQFFELLNKVAAGEITLAEASAKFKRETDQAIGSLGSLANEAEKTADAIQKLTIEHYNQTNALNEVKAEVKDTKKELERSIKTNERLAKSNDKLTDKYNAEKEAAKEARLANKNKTKSVEEVSTAIESESKKTKKLTDIVKENAEAQKKSASDITASLKTAKDMATMFRDVFNNGAGKQGSIKDFFKEQFAGLSASIKSEMGAVANNTQAFADTFAKTLRTEFQAILVDSKNIGAGIGTNIKSGIAESMKHDGANGKLSETLELQIAELTADLEKRINEYAETAGAGGLERTLEEADKLKKIERARKDIDLVKTYQNWGGTDVKDSYSKTFKEELNETNKLYSEMERAAEQHKYKLSDIQKERLNEAKTLSSNIAKVTSGGMGGDKSGADEALSQINEYKKRLNELATTQKKSLAKSAENYENNKEQQANSLKTSISALKTELSETKRIYTEMERDTEKHKYRLSEIQKKRLAEASSISEQIKKLGAIGIDGNHIVAADSLEKIKELRPKLEPLATTQKKSLYMSAENYDVNKKREAADLANTVNTLKSQLSTTESIYKEMEKITDKHHYELSVKQQKRLLEAKTTAEKIKTLAETGLSSGKPLSEESLGKIESLKTSLATLANSHEKSLSMSAAYYEDVKKQQNAEIAGALHADKVNDMLFQNEMQRQRKLTTQIADSVKIQQGELNKLSTGYSSKSSIGNLGKSKSGYMVKTDEEQAAYKELKNTTVLLNDLKKLESISYDERAAMMKQYVNTYEMQAEKLSNMITNRLLEEQAAASSINSLKKELGVAESIYKEMEKITGKHHYELSAKQQKRLSEAKSVMGQLRKLAESGIDSGKPLSDESIDKIETLKTALQSLANVHVKSLSMSAKNYEHNKKQQDSLLEGALYADKINDIIFQNQIKRHSKLSKSISTTVKKQESDLNKVGGVSGGFGGLGKKASSYVVKTDEEKDIYKDLQNTLDALKQLKTAESMNYDERLSLMTKYVTNYKEQASKLTGIINNRVEEEKKIKEKEEESVRALSESQKLATKSFKDSWNELYNAIGVNWRNRNLMESLQQFAHGFRRIGHDMGLFFDGISNRIKTFMGYFSGFVALTAGGFAKATVEAYDFGKTIVKTTEEVRGYNIALYGLMKTHAGVNDLLSVAEKVTRDLPIGFKTMQESVKGLVLIGPVRDMLKNTQDIEKSMGSLFNIIVGLSQMQPEWGEKGAIFSLRNALTGDLRSLQRRFELPVRAIFSAEGVPLQNLQYQPEKMLETLDTYVSSFYSTETLEMSTNQFSKVIEKIEGLWIKFLSTIGESGLYDEITKDVTKVRDAIGKIVDSESFLQVTNVISDSFASVYNSIKNVSFYIIEAIGESFSIDALKNINSAVDLFKKLGDGFKYVAYFVYKLEEHIIKGNLVSYIKDSLSLLIQNIAKPISYIKDLIKEMFGDLQWAFNGFKTLFNKVFSNVDGKVNELKNNKALQKGLLWTLFFGPTNVAMLMGSIALLINSAIGVFSNGINVMIKMVGMLSNAWMLAFSMPFLKIPLLAATAAVLLNNDLIVPFSKTLYRTFESFLVWLVEQFTVTWSKIVTNNPILGDMYGRPDTLKFISKEEKTSAIENVRKERDDILNVVLKEIRAKDEIGANMLESMFKYGTPDQKDATIKMLTDSTRIDNRFITSIATGTEKFFKSTFSTLGGLAGGLLGGKAGPKGGLLAGGAGVLLGNAAGSWVGNKIKESLYGIAGIQNIKKLDKAVANLEAVKAGDIVYKPEDYHRYITDNPDAKELAKNSIETIKRVLGEKAFENAKLVVNGIISFKDAVLYGLNENLNKDLNKYAVAIDVNGAPIKANVDKLANSTKAGSSMIISQMEQLGYMPRITSGYREATEEEIKTGNYSAHSRKLGIDLQSLKGNLMNEALFKMFSGLIDEGVITKVIAEQSPTAKTFDFGSDLFKKYNILTSNVDKSGKPLTSDGHFHVEFAENMMDKIHKAMGVFDDLMVSDMDISKFELKDFENRFKENKDETGKRIKTLTNDLLMSYESVLQGMHQYTAKSTNIVTQAFEEFQGEFGHVFGPDRVREMQGQLEKVKSDRQKIINQYIEKNRKAGVEISEKELNDAVYSQLMDNTVKQGNALFESSVVTFLSNNMMDATQGLITGNIAGIFANGKFIETLGSIFDSLEIAEKENHEIAYAFYNILKRGQTNIGTVKTFSTKRLQDYIMKQGLTYSTFDEKSTRDGFAREFDSAASMDALNYALFKSADYSAANKAYEQVLTEIHGNLEMGANIDDAIKSALAAVYIGEEKSVLESVIQLYKDKKQEIIDSIGPIQKERKEYERLTAALKTYNLAQLTANRDKYLKSRSQDVRRAYGAEIETRLAEGIEPYEYGELFENGIQASIGAWENFSLTVYNSGKEMADGLRETFETGFFDYMNGEITSLSDMFKNLGNVIKRTLTTIVAQMASRSLTNGLMNFSLGNIFGGAAGGLMGGTVGGAISGLGGELVNGAFGTWFGNSGRTGASGGVSNNVGSEAAPGLYDLKFRLKGDEAAGGVSGTNPSGNIAGMAMNSITSAAASTALKSTGGFIPMVKQAFGAKTASFMSGAGGFLVTKALPVVAAYSIVKSLTKTKDHTGEAKAAKASWDAYRTAMLDGRKDDQLKYYMANDDYLSNYNFSGIDYWNTTSKNWYGRKTVTGHMDAGRFKYDMYSYQQLLTYTGKQHYNNMVAIEKISNTNALKAANMRADYDAKKVSLTKDIYNREMAKLKTDLSFEDYQKQVETVTSARDAYLQAEYERMQTELELTNLKKEQTYKEMEYQTFVNSNGQNQIDAMRTAIEIEKRRLAEYDAYTTEWYDAKMGVMRSELELATTLMNSARDLKASITTMFKNMITLSGTTNSSSVPSILTNTLKIKDLISLKSRINDGTATDADYLGAGATYKDVRVKKERPTLMSHYKTIRVLDYNKEEILANIQDQMEYLQNAMELDVQGISTYNSIIKNIYANTDMAFLDRYQELSNMFEMYDLLKNDPNFDNYEKELTKKELDNAVLQYYADLSAGISDMLKAGFILETDSLVTNFVNSVDDGLNLIATEIYTEMRDITKRGTMKSNILSTIRDMEDFDIYNQVINSDAMSALKNSMGSSIDFSETSDPYQAYFNWNKALIENRIANAEYQNEEWYAAQNDLFILMIENAEKLKERAEEMNRSLEDMLGKIEETMRMRIAEERETAKGDVYFVDVGSTRDSQKMLDRMLSAVKTNDPEAMALIEEFRKKMVGIR